MVGVFIKENDFELDSLEQLFENRFGTINSDKEFYDWAQKETLLHHDEIECKVKHIIDNIYDIREPDIFSKIPKLKFFTATNHLSYFDVWFKTLPISGNFKYFVNSAVVNAQKPEAKFYEILTNAIDEKPNDILFIDDNDINCYEAKKFGLNILKFDRNTVLSEEILRII